MKHEYLMRASMAALALMVAGCEKSDFGSDDSNTQMMAALPDLPATLPLEPGEAGALSYAPDVSDLGDAQEIGVARVADASQVYGYADAACGFQGALGDAPPDYAFAYDDVEPWAWQATDNSMMFAEPIDDGYRYYYYRPGETEPYFVRDPYYAYGFAGGMLAALYAADGAIVPFADYGPRVLYASRYFARGRDLYATWRRAPRRAVLAGSWATRRPLIAASYDRWSGGRVRQPAWGAFYASSRPRLDTYWREERVRRGADARRFADWRDTGFRDSPPPRAIPARWQEARWARDDRRYRPARDDARGDDRRGGRGDDRRAERREDRLADRGGDNGRDRERLQAQRERERAQQERQRDRERQQGDRQAGRGGADAGDRRAERLEAREQRRDDRQRDQRIEQREQQQRERADRDRAERGQRERADRERGQIERQQRDRADRERRDQSDRQQRQQEMQAERQQRQQAERQQQQAERQQRMQAERQQQQQAERQQQRQQEQMQRQQQMQAERQQRQQQEQMQRRQAEQAQRQQQMQAERQQRQQQEQMQRQQQQQAQRQQQQQADRAAQQQQRQQQREERRANRRDQ